MRTFHLAKYESSEKATSTNHKGALAKAFDKQRQEFSQDELKRLIVKFIVSTNQPFIITETESYMEMMCYGRTVKPKIPN
ncbi:unnamed protein product, partial [Allacma fusca]